MRIKLLALMIFTWSLANAQGLYDTDQVTTIEITFQDNNWNQILNDYYAADMGQRLLAEVEINGVLFDSVGVRYRGGGTYDPNNAKNPLNIKLDYLKNQDYQSYSAIKLSNGAKDPSWLREVLGFEIARNFMEAPQANYASVFVNGNFQGVYSNVESINSKFLSERFLSDNNNTRFEANPSYSFDEIPAPPFSCTEGHGASLEYLGPNDVCYFAHYELQSATGWNELRELADLLQNNPQDLRSLVDEDRFVWMSMFNNLIASLDSYLGASPRNYFIFKTDNGHWAPVINDLNETFGRFPWLTIPAPGDPQPPLSFYADLSLFEGENNSQKPLLKALFSGETNRKKYVAHMRTAINQLFLNGWFEQRGMDLQSLIDAEVMSDNNSFYTHSDFVSNFNNTVIDPFNGEDAYGLFELMDGRIAFLLGQPELQATPPTVSNVTASPSLPSPGTQVNITAAVGNGNAVWLGSRNNRKEMFELMPMADDGAHGDGSAGDGVFGATVTAQVGGLQYYVYAENNDAGMFSPEKAEFEFYDISTTSNIVINEIMASNQTAVADQDGEYDDWVELYNNSITNIDLSGWYLSDDFLNPTKWQFPNGSFLNANGFLTVWTDNDELQDGLHTSFNLNADGEELLLVRPDGTIADQVVFGPQTTDVAYGRCPNGIGSFDQIPFTFGSDNNAACANSTSEAADAIGLHIFPNPANGQINIETDLQNEIGGKLWSPFGQMARQFKLAGDVSLDVSDLPPGLYFVELGGRIVEKVMIAR